MLQKFLSRQLAMPSGWFGRLFAAPWLARINVRMNLLALKSLELRQNDRLLEIGFGSGSLISQALKLQRCQHIAGLELSPEMIRYASKKLKHAISDGSLELRYGKIEELPFDDGVFERVVTVNTLYFWTNPRLALAQCARVLSRDGVLVICFNAKQDMLKWPGHVHGFRLYELEEVKELLSECGFINFEMNQIEDPIQGRVYAVRAQRQ